MGQCIMCNILYISAFILVNFMLLFLLFMLSTQNDCVWVAKLSIGTPCAKSSWLEPCSSSFCYVFLHSLQSSFTGAGIMYDCASASEVTQEEYALWVKYDCPVTNEVNLNDMGKSRPVPNHDKMWNICIYFLRYIACRANMGESF